MSPSLGITAGPRITRLALARVRVADPGRLLPRSTALARCYAAAQKSRQKPAVLAKPTRYQAPSHPTGPRRPTKPLFSPASKEQAAGPNIKLYPGVMAPKGTWEYWFWNNSIVHVILSLGTIVFLAATTFVLNYTHHSSFRHLLPPSRELWTDPGHFFSIWWQVIQLHEHDRNQKTIARRSRELDDISRRGEYMREHVPADSHFFGKYVGSIDAPISQARAQGRAAAEFAALEEERLDAELRAKKKAPQTKPAQ